MNYKIGIDIVEVGRFTAFKKNSRFLLNNFSQQELTYCFAFKEAKTHLAGTFAAKEAVWKALERKNLIMSLIEIRRDKNGQPSAWLDNKRIKNIKVSISHTAKIATAVAINL